MDIRSAKYLSSLLMLAVLVLSEATARPQPPIESQDGFEYEPAVANFRSSYYSYPSPVMVDSIPLEKLQMLVGQIKPSPFIRAYAAPPLDTIYRLPESKRQVRYRQCYFNPISCFRK